MRRYLLALCLACAPLPALAAHAIAMHGEPKYGEGFRHFDYVNPEAPKGGTLRLARVGTFDSVNPFIVRGVPAEGLDLTYTSLLRRSFDEPFSLYAMVAERVETPDDRSWVRFTLREGATFHDGSPITVDDVIFSLEALRDQGRPNHRTYYSQVKRIERPGPLTVTFHFGGEGNRELPLILGLMPIVSKAQFEGRPFDRTTLEPILTAGPYRIEHVDPGRSITYRRIPGHWSEDLPAVRGQHNFDVIRIDYYRDQNTALTAFQTGQYDLREEPDPKAWAQAYDFPAARRGEVLLRTIPHGRPAGMYGLALNTRRAIFADRRVRAAIGHGFDFDWVNRNLYHGAYERTASYFDNSDLAARGLPSDAEQALLAPFRDSLPPQLFERAYAPPGADAPDRRARLGNAAALLEDAGWQVRDMRRVHAETGRPFTFEIMLARREQEKLALHFAANLRRLGIETHVRTVDSAQYQQRLATYDFDAIIWRWDQSLSPGNEQAFYWSQAAAGTEGTRNYPGIREPAADAMIRRIADAPDRAALVAATRALDRVLLWGHYVVPLFHLTADRVAHWDRFGWPETTPVYGLRLETWWEEPEKAAALGRR